MEMMVRHERGWVGIEGDEIVGVDKRKKYRFPLRGSTATMGSPPEELSFSKWLVSNRQQRKGKDWSVGHIAPIQRHTFKTPEDPAAAARLVNYIEENAHVKEWLEERRREREPQRAVMVGSPTVNIINQAAPTPQPVRCSYCRTSNPPTSHHCAHCGAPLMRR